MLQELDLEIKDKNGVENVVSDKLSRLENNEVTKKESNITEEFLDEHLMSISDRPWFTDMANYKATKNVCEDYTWKKRYNSTKMLLTICGMSLICLKLVLMV